MGMTALGCAFLLVGSGSWQTVKMEAGTVAMPGQPTRQVVPTETPGGQLDLVMYTLETPSQVYFASFLDFKQSIPNGSEQDVLKNAFAGMQSRLGKAKVLASNAGEYQKMSFLHGRVAFERQQIKANVEWRGLVKGNQFFQLMVIEKPGQRDAEGAKKFFASFNR